MPTFLRNFHVIFGGHTSQRRWIERTDMKKIISGIFVCLTLTACSQTEKGAGIGAASGAIIGGLASGTWEGAAVGAAAGGAGGAVIGNISERNDRNRRDRWEYRDRRSYDCRYRDNYGRCR